MNFEKFFRLISYAAVFCGFLALWVSGTFGVVWTLAFGCLMVVAWLIEGRRWQISEKVGTAMIVAALPVFYLVWKFQVISLSGGDTAIAGLLGRMILSLTAVKLLQRKSDRDWIFLYLMSFFEVLLAAGLSISALYLGSLLLYLLVMVCAVIAFEIRKTAHHVDLKIAGLTVKQRDPVSESKTSVPVRRLPTTAVALIVFIVALALPMFFMLPRVGGAGFGGNQSGLSTSTGFSDSVKLGRSGFINESDEVVMRVKLDSNAQLEDGLYFRGTSLDSFDNQTWSKSKMLPKESFSKGDREMIQIDFPMSRENLSIQTIYLEPLDTPVLFALPRAVAIQGGFQTVYKDTYGTVSYQRNLERITYKVLSDLGHPSADQLRADDRPYTTDVQNYRQLPESYDIRIAGLAASLTAGKKNKYDKARAVEAYLQNNFGYTLEQKAGGDEPLSDFLFNVREGHCEYFATAMAIMLRTQGIATRVVNGYHGGEYNDATDFTIVRQRNAHEWVEVFFPKENTWIRFDPTPVAGQPTGAAQTGITGTVNKYLEALETLWIQYFVAFDNQEQRSLARSMRDGVVDYQVRLTSFVAGLQNDLGEWWSEVQGNKGMRASFKAVGLAIAYIAGAVLAVFLIIWAFRKLIRLRIWQSLWARVFKKQRATIVEFYERMQHLLAGKGIIREPHQTPLEFAYATGMPEAVKITEKYNRVRFGEKELSTDEARDIESWLKFLATEIEISSSR